MPYSTDADLQDYQADILDMGVSSFAEEHARAQSDIQRRLRGEWWPKTGYSNEMDNSLLTSSQFERLSVYLVLWKYAIPALTNWIEGDRFQMMIAFFKARYEEEWDAILKDGVEYDANEDSSISNSEKAPIHHGRLFR